MVTAPAENQEFGLPRSEFLYLEVLPDRWPSRFHVRTANTWNGAGNEVIVTPFRLSIAMSGSVLQLMGPGSSPG